MTEQSITLFFSIFSAILLIASIISTRLIVEPIKKQNLILGLATLLIFLLTMDSPYILDYLYPKGRETNGYYMIGFGMLLFLSVLFYLGSTLFNARKLAVVNFILLLITSLDILLWFYFVISSALHPL